MKNKKAKFTLLVDSQAQVGVLYLIKENCPNTTAGFVSGIRFGYQSYRITIFTFFYSKISISNFFEQSYKALKDQ